MKMIILASAILSLTSLGPESCDCYRILGVFPFQARSHFIMFEALMKGLARKGHQVDVISTFPQKNPLPNYTDIIELPLSSSALVNNRTYASLGSWTSIMIHWGTLEIGNKLCTGLEHPEMKKLIRNPPKDPPYDVVMTEFLTASCYFALGHHLKVPMIGVISSALYPWNNRMIANPASLAFVPNNLIDYDSAMNFWQRMCNTVYAIFNDLYFQYLSSPQDELIRKYFGENAPGAREAERNVALVLTNTHCTIQGGRPLTSALIEVGGLHLQDDGPELSEDLKEWMDQSTNGFVYFTLGSMLNLESFPEKTIRTFYKSLGKISPVRVLMKVPNPEQLPSGLPMNFRTFKWAPQMKVLAHKNAKAFITHGGLMSAQEAIHYAVPLIAIPIFADQFTNVNYLARKKVVLKLDYQDITEEKLDETLDAILYDPMYKNRMIEFSAQFRDRPLNPMDTAIWWVEYVTKYGGQDLRSPAHDLYWWQIELFDVYAVFLLIVAFFVFITFVLMRCVLRKLFSIRNFIGVSKAKKDE